MIILEGADGAGKTYAAKWLSSQLQIPLHHFGGPPGSKEDLINRINEMFLNPDRIFDRCSIISEPIYGPITRGNCFFTDKEIEDYLWILKKQAKIIYCRPSIETILSHKLVSKVHKSIEHTILVKDSIKEIITAYDLFMNCLKQKLAVFHFDRDTMALKEILSYIEGVN